jgi:hypothetical protein
VTDAGMAKPRDGDVQDILAKPSTLIGDRRGAPGKPGPGCTRCLRSGSYAIEFTLKAAKFSLERRLCLMRERVAIRSDKYERGVGSGR